MAGLLNSHRFVVAASGIARVGTVITDPMGTLTFQLPVGSAAGDWCFVTLGQGISSSLGISGGDAGNPWTYLALSTKFAAAYKFLTAGDIGATFTVATAIGFKFAGVVVYEGVTTAALKGTSYDNSATMASLAGFVHASGGVVLSLFNGYRSHEAPSVAPSSGFTEFMDTMSTDANGVGEIAMAENTAYNDTDITWTNSGSPFIRNGLYVFELT